MKAYFNVLTKAFKNPIYKPLLLLLAFIVLCSHNLYIKLETYFLEPNEEATLNLYNGTFEKSENIITRDRILDASILFNGQRLNIDSSQWTDKDSTITQFKFTPIEPGTYVTGVSTKARNIELSAEKFNDYLEHDGVLDMLDYRKNNDLLDKDAVESYEKHVKAIYQVGDTKTDDWKTVLGYPIELVPLENPYNKFNGDKLDVTVLLEGEPLANQLLYVGFKESNHHHNSGNHSHEPGREGKKHSNAHKHDNGEHRHGHKEKEHSHKHQHGNEQDSHEHSHDEKKHSRKHKADNGEHSHKHDHEGKKYSHEHKHDDGKHSHEHEHEGKKHSHEHEHDDDEHSHKHKEASKSNDHHKHDQTQQLRTNAEGIVTVNLAEEGIYFLRTIYMVNVTDSDELTHQSKWATLTFEVTHKHDSTTHTHDDHDHEVHIPTWVFALGSLLVIGLLFLVFRKRS